MGAVISSSDNDSSDESGVETPQERTIEKHPESISVEEVKKALEDKQVYEQHLSATDSSDSDSSSSSSSEDTSFFGDSTSDEYEEIEIVDITEGILYGMGNPLLDISANVGEGYLKKYDMKKNDAILAEEKHKPMYTELIEMFPVEYIAGGATQNSIKVAQWMLGVPHATTFVGCVGEDKFAAILKEKAEEVGVKTDYYVQTQQPTGTCAALICGHDRSLCANLAAANEYKKENHLDKPEIWAHIEKAKYYYIAGFFLTVSVDSIIEIGKHAATNGKMFMMNLSAPFLSQFFKDQQLTVLPYVDILFGNETEAEAFSEANNYGTKDLKEIARKIAGSPKVNSTRQRIVIFTHGSEATIVATGPHAQDIKEFQVNPIDPKDIVDTNGAGDAFVGGFLSQLVLGKDLQKCIDGGHFAGKLIIQQSGCTFPKECTFN